MKNVVPTIWGNRLQNIKQQNLPYKHIPFSTINERLEIRGNENVLSTDMPALKILCIGNGGHGHRTGVNGFALPSRIPHLPDHAALYNQIPFVMRTMDNDISQTERRKYALRKIQEFDGVNYICYYGRRLTIDTTQDVGIKHTVVENGVKTTVDYKTSNANLYPVHPDLPNTGSVATSSEYLSTSSTVDLSFSEADVEELINVARIIYNDEDYAIISEFAICNAVDRTITINTAQGNVNFAEAVHCSVAFFAIAQYNLIFHRKGFDYTIECGATEPLLGTEQISTARVLTP